jgi:hypothetical protein
MRQELEVQVRQFVPPGNLPGQTELGETAEEPPDLQDPEVLIEEPVDAGETSPLDAVRLQALLAEGLAAFPAIDLRIIRAR